jgi:propanol-preferring alcohol dehydrogenase
MDAVIDATPAWLPVLCALTHLKPGGRLIINAIRKESADRAVLTGLDYSAHLWLEREVQSVANVTRADVRAILQLAAQTSIRPEARSAPLEEANQALHDIRTGGGKGAVVLVPL